MKAASQLPSGVAMVYSLQKSVHEAAGDEALLSSLDHLVIRVDSKREPVTGDEVMRVVQKRFGGRRSLAVAVMTLVMSATPLAIRAIIAKLIIQRDGCFINLPLPTTSGFTRAGFPNCSCAYRCFLLLYRLVCRGLRLG